MEETDSKMWPELIAKALVDAIAKLHELREALAAWTEASKAKAEASKAKAERYKGERSKEAASSSSDYSLAKCVIALNEMRNVDEDSYVKALEKLKNDPEWREIFLNMTLYRKEQWLYRVYRGKS
ncbi:uncharacterized protein LOC129312412 [Prosopis cineraria]|uniref:uncharacterized protein LOC129312412 n=1 Tax=Prosopis cineraria TaxID=364024 RepID=UPI0024103ABB|nr:uncharacterized protein LOC129312412 [Prosopis cineraria]